MEKTKKTARRFLSTVAAAAILASSAHADTADQSHMSRLEATALQNSSTIAVSKAGIELIKNFEEFRTKPYNPGDGLTIGYGHKIKPGEHFTTITQKEADAILRKDIAIAENALNTYVHVPLTQNQYDSLTSFVFNIGEGAFATSTMLKDLNSGKTAAAAHEFGRWVHVRKKVKVGKEVRIVKAINNGLVNRRKSEKALFLLTT